MLIDKNTKSKNITNATGIDEPLIINYNQEKEENLYKYIVSETNDNLPNYFIPEKIVDVYSQSLGKKELKI